VETNGYNANGWLTAQWTPAVKGSVLEIDIFAAGDRF
jgi:hypothetical protein